MDRHEGLKLLTHAPLADLQAMAQAIRYEKNPGNNVTFVIDTNPNYTNICSIACSFCAFCRSPNELYHKSPDEVMDLIARAEQSGITTVLLQGGIHEGVTIEYLVSLVHMSLTQFPSIHPHFFSAPEIFHAAKTSHISVDEALRRLFDAGQRTIPGGGAEILSPRVHHKISPKKLPPDQWILVHEKAHAIGFRTTATMMFGHVETDEDIIEHLDAIRAAQGRTGGFSAFIPWSFKPTNNPLGAIVPSAALPERYLRIIAFSRIYLDNFDHITASWFSEGKSAGMQALHYGADDFGGTVCEESVHKAAGHVNTISFQEIVRLIEYMGYQPSRRNSFYEIM